MLTTILFYPQRNQIKGNTTHPSSIHQSIHQAINLSPPSPPNKTAHPPLSAMRNTIHPSRPTIPAEQDSSSPLSATRTPTHPPIHPPIHPLPTCEGPVLNDRRIQRNLHLKAGKGKGAKRGGVKHVQVREVPRRVRPLVRDLFIRSFCAGLFSFLPGRYLPVTLRSVTSQLRGGGVCGWRREEERREQKRRCRGRCTG